MPSLIFTCHALFSDIPWRPALFSSEQEEEWICGTEAGTGEVKGEETVVGMHCMKEEFV